MKFAVALVLVAVALPATFAMFAESVNDDMHKMEEECMAESGASMDEVDMARKNKMIPDMPNMNKWAMCMMKKNMMMMQDGSVNTDMKTMKILADVPDAMQKAVEKCKVMKADTVEQTARMMMNCMMAENMMMMAMTMLKKN